MKGTSLIRVGDRYHLRLPDGAVHRHRSWEEARVILVYAGVDPYQALALAIILTNSIQIEYRRVGRHRWWVNGKPQPVSVIRGLLKETGCGKAVIDATLRIHKLCADAEGTITTIREACKEIDEETVRYRESLRTRLRKSPAE